MLSDAHCSCFSAVAPASSIVPSKVVALKLWVQNSSKTKGFVCPTNSSCIATAKLVEADHSLMVFIQLFQGLLYLLMTRQQIFTQEHIFVSFPHTCILYIVSPIKMFPSSVHYIFVARAMQFATCLGQGTFFYPLGKPLPSAYYPNILHQPS